MYIHYEKVRRYLKNPTGNYPYKPTNEIINEVKRLASIHENYTYVSDRRNEMGDFLFFELTGYDLCEPLFWVDGLPEYLSRIKKTDEYSLEILVKCLKNWDDEQDWSRSDISIPKIPEGKGTYKYPIRKILDYKMLYNDYHIYSLGIDGIAFNRKGNVTRAIFQSKSYTRVQKWFEENQGKAFYDGFGSHIILDGFELNGMRNSGAKFYTNGVKDQLYVWFKELLIAEYGFYIKRESVFESVVSSIITIFSNAYNITYTTTQLEAQKLNGEEIHPLDEAFPDGLPSFRAPAKGTFLLYMLLMIFFSMFNIRIYLWIFSTILFILFWIGGNNN